MPGSSGDKALVALCTQYVFHVLEKFIDILLLGAQLSVLFTSASAVSAFGLTGN